MTKVIIFVSNFSMKLHLGYIDYLFYTLWYDYIVFHYSLTIQNVVVNSYYMHLEVDEKITFSSTVVSRVRQVSQVLILLILKSSMWSYFLCSVVSIALMFLLVLSGKKWCYNDLWTLLCHNWFFYICYAIGISKCFAVVATLRHMNQLKVIKTNLFQYNECFLEFFFY